MVMVVTLVIVVVVMTTRTHGEQTKFARRDVLVRPKCHRDGHQNGPNEQEISEGSKTCCATVDTGSDQLEQLVSAKQCGDDEDGNGKETHRRGVRSGDLLRRAVGIVIVGGNLKPSGAVKPLQQSRQEAVPR